MKISKEEAIAILQEDIKTFEQGVNKLVKVELTQCQYDAVVRFVFNVGLGNFAKSTMLKRINAKRFDEVPAEFLRWVHAGGKVLNGLVKRRHSEAAMWNGIYPQDGHKHEGPMPQCVDKPKNKLSPHLTHTVPATSIIALAPKAHDLIPAITPDVTHGLMWAAMFVLIFAAGVVTHALLTPLVTRKEGKHGTPEAV